MTDQFVAEIRVFPFSFPPVGWALCNGQLLPISQNTALFSLLGTNYGGDGKSTFGLPDLRGRAPLHWGEAHAGLSERFLGEEGGVGAVALLQSEMPAHTHVLQANTIDLADTNVPGPGVVFAQSAGGALYQAAADTQLDPTALTTSGGSFPHNNMQPYLTLHFCIALQGIYPPRS